MRQRRVVCTVAGTVLMFFAIGAPAGLLGATGRGVAGSPPLQRFTQPLPIPPVIDARAGGAVALDEVNGTRVFHPSLPATPTFGYVPAGATPTAGATYLGPTIEAQRGNPVSLTVTNKLAAHPLAGYIDTSLESVSALDATAPRTSTHLHGGHTPAASDGGPVATYRRSGVDAADAAGGTGAFTYDYPNDQAATELWYHDHALGITRLNVEAGLAGLYLVRDAYDTGRAGNAVGLPYGDHEVPLVLQDRSFNADGTFAYPVGAFAGMEPRTDYPDEWAPESFGDVAIVNGAAWPYKDVEPAIYRLRVLNGSNARIYDLTLRGAAGEHVQASMWQIGSEGGLFDAPVALDHLVLAPGERADLLVDFRSLPRGQKVVLANTAPVPYPDGDRAPGRGGVPLPSLMEFRVTGRASTSPDGVIPTTLRGGQGQPAPLPTLTATASRTIALNEILDPATGEPTEVLMNNLGFHEHVDGTVVMPRESHVETVALNTVEEWDIVNTTGDTHPIHLHLTQFRVLDRQAIDVDGFVAAWNPGLPSPSASDSWNPLPPFADYLVGPRMAPKENEVGWKDTVQVPPGTVTRIVVPFGGTAAGIAAPFTGDAVGATPERFTGEYVFHCHILEHEDNDMMLPYRIVG